MLSKGQIDNVRDLVEFADWYWGIHAKLGYFTKKQWQDASQDWVKALRLFMTQ
jgi:hypothetical protein